jgi:hypothetical protein
MTALLPPTVKVHLALGYIDMRKGIDGLAMLVQRCHRTSGRRRRTGRNATACIE